MFSLVGTVLQNIGFSFEHKTVMWTMIWELIQRCGGDVPSLGDEIGIGWGKVIGCFNWDLLETLQLGTWYHWDVIKTFLCDILETCHWDVLEGHLETSLGVSFETNLGDNADLPMVRPCHVLLRRCHDVH